MRHGEDAESDKLMAELKIGPGYRVLSDDGEEAGELLGEGAALPTAMVIHSSHKEGRVTFYRRRDPDHALDPSAVPALNPMGDNPEELSFFLKDYFEGRLVGEDPAALRTPAVVDEAVPSALAAPSAGCGRGYAGPVGRDGNGLPSGGRGAVGNGREHR